MLEFIVMQIRKANREKGYCRISHRGGMGMSPCIMGLTTQDPYILKEHTKLYKIVNLKIY